MAECKESPPSYETAAVTCTRNTTSKSINRSPFPLDLPILNLLRNKRVILASRSPRRKQIFSLVRPSPYRGTILLMRCSSDLKMSRLSPQQSLRISPRKILDHSNMSSRRQFKNVSMYTRLLSQTRRFLSLTPPSLLQLIRSWLLLLAVY